MPPQTAPINIAAEMDKPHCRLTCSKVALSERCMNAGRNRVVPKANTENTVSPMTISVNAEVILDHPVPSSPK